MPVTPITDWGTALITAVAATLAMIVAAIPKVIGFLVILLMGWAISYAIGGIVAGILHAVRFNDLSRRSGMTTFIRNMGLRNDPAHVLGAIAKWFVRLIALVVAFDALGLPAVSQIFNQMLAWIPNLVLALVVLVITGILATAASDLVRGTTAGAGLGNPTLFSTLTRWTVWAFGIVVAVNQVGIASSLVNTLFMAFVGAVALALGLAFGLGGRDTAGQLLNKWYTNYRRAGPKLRRATDAAQREAMGPGGGGTGRLGSYSPE